MDWGALHDSSFFLFLVKIDYDAKPKVSSHKSYGEKYQKGHFPLLSQLEPCKREIGTSSGTSEGYKPSASPVGPIQGPPSSPYPDICPNPSLSLTITLLLVGHCYYLRRRMGREKIIYFLWIQSEYNLSCMLSKYWELNKILQVIQKLLISYDLIPLIARSAT